MAVEAGLALAVAFRIPRARRVLRFSDEDWRVLSVLCRPPTSHLPQSSSGLITRSRRSRASFCPAFRGVLACLATGGIDWFEDRFDAIAGDYDTATSGDAAGLTKRVGNVAAPGQRERPSPVSARRCWATDKSRSFCSSKSCSSKSSNSRQMIRFSVAMPRIGSPAEARSWWRRSRQAAASANRWWSEKVRASLTYIPPPLRTWASLPFSVKLLRACDAIRSPA
jgi:hypothetical protein